MDELHELELLVRSRYPLVAVETSEEDRLQRLLHQAAASLGLAFHVWSLTGGLQRDGRGAGVYDSLDPRKALDNLPSLVREGVLLFKDLPYYLKQPDVVRRLRDLSELEPGQRRTLVLVASSLELPPELQKVSARFRLAPPSEEELRSMIQSVVTDLGRMHRVQVSLTDEQYHRLLEALSGLTLFEAERAVTRAILDDGALTATDVAGVQQAKRQVLAEDGLLEYVPRRPEDSGLGGLDSFKEWIRKRRGALSPEAKEFGLPPPKGVVLLGVQGCGKTFAARTVAALWELPLLRLEPGRLYDKFVGESEKNLEKALWLAEQMAPCVLLTDEIEKGFSAAGGASVDGGLSRRMLGRLLGWLQDRKGAVFVVATCNDVEDLPPEMLRKGRFDEIFFVDLPDADERKEIYALHLARRGRKPESFGVEKLAEAAAGFSGAEIEQSVIAALYTAFQAKRDIDTDIVLGEIRATVPLSVTRKEEIEALRAWARERAVPAH